MIDDPCTLLLILEGYVVSTKKDAVVLLIYLRGTIMANNRIPPFIYCVHVRGAAGAPFFRRSLKFRQHACLVQNTKRRNYGESYT